MGIEGESGYRIGYMMPWEEIGGTEMATLRIVATEVDGVPEIVLDRRNGLLHKHEDDSQLTALLLSLLQDEARAKTLGEAGQCFVRDEFSCERFASSMSNVYRNVIGLSTAELSNSEKID